MKMLRRICDRIRQLRNAHRATNARMDSEIEMLTCDYEKALESNNVAYEAVFNNYLIARKWGGNPLDEIDALDLILKEADGILSKVYQEARI